MQEDSYSSDEKMDNESKVGGKRELSLKEINQMRIKWDDLEKWIDAENLS